MTNTLPVILEHLKWINKSSPTNVGSDPTHKDWLRMKVLDSVKKNLLGSSTLTLIQCLCVRSDPTLEGLLFAPL